MYYIYCFTNLLFHIKTHRSMGLEGDDEQCISIVAIGKDVWKALKWSRSVKQCPMNEFQTTESLI